MKPGKPLLVASSSLMTRLPMHEDISVGGVRNSESFELAQNSNCWICEGWTEHRFTYEPGFSDDNPNHDEFKPIKLHLGIDNFEGDLMMKSESGREYEVYRMLPPGSHQYFFSINGEPCVAKDQNLTSKKNEKKPKKVMLDLEKLEIPRFEGATTTISPKKGNTPKDSKKATPKNVRSKEVEQEPEPIDYYELELPEVNYTDNILQTRTIYSNE